jgi:hypothetical protein
MADIWFSDAASLRCPSLPAAQPDRTNTEKPNTENLKLMTTIQSASLHFREAKNDKDYPSGIRCRRLHPIEKNELSSLPFCKVPVEAETNICNTWAEK